MFGLFEDLLKKVRYEKDYEYAIKKFRNNGDAVFNYDFMMSLKEKDYPKYLCLAYKIKTGQKLNLKHPKTLNEKIQWLKIYDNIPIKAQLTDKVLVRDWVKEKIGEEYLKPVLWIGDNFDDIPFDKLPNSFIIKCNHGCKWQFIIKNKNKFIENKQVYSYVKNHIDGWMKQSFFGWSDFETQYLNIKPQIIIESLLRDNINKSNNEFWVWCVDSLSYIMKSEKEYHKKALELSSILAKDFKFVRVDWIVYKGKLYFGEMTFTPMSGFLTEDMYRQSFYENISKHFSVKR